MTVELRSRQAAAGIHAAVTQVEPRVLATRRRLFGRRAFIAIFLAALTPPAGVALVNAIRGDDPRTNQRIVDDSRTTESNDESRPDNDEPRPDEVRKPDSVSTLRAGDHAQAPTALGREPSAEDRRRSSAGEARATGLCDPVISDAKGDVDDPAMDIIESSITYDASRNTLVIRHVFDDIPASHAASEELLYDFDFDLDAMTYHAMAYIGPLEGGGEWTFSVQREDRTKSAETNQLPRHYVMQTTGRVDRQGDTVTLEINIDEFNRGERRISREEGLPPAAELKRGSTLTDLILYAYAQAVAPTARDEARGCDFVVE